MKLQNVISFLPFFTIFYDYDYFLLFGTILGILIYQDKIKINNISNLLKTTFVLFLCLRFFSAFDERFNLLWQRISQKNYSLDGKFIDLQSVFLAFKCNFEKIADYQFLGSDQIYNCPHTVSYGPFFEIIGFANNPIISTFIAVCTVLSLICIFYLNLSKNLSDKEIYLLTLTFLSPPINFVLERMNFDVIIYIFIFLIFKFIKNNILKNTLLFVLVLMKFYPIFIIFGSAVYNFAKNKQKEFKEDLLFSVLIIYLLIYLNYLESGIENTVRPFRPDRTFGFLSQSFNFSNQFNWNVAYVYLLLIFLVSFLVYQQKSLIHQSTFLDNQLNNVLIFMFLFLGLFANYDYRLSFLVIISLPILKSNNKMLFYTYFIFLFSSPGLLNSYSELFQLVENYQFVYLDIPFFFFYSVVLIEYFYFLKNNYQKKLNK